MNLLSGLHAWLLLTLVQIVCTEGKDYTRNDLFPQRSFKRVSASANKTRFTEEEKQLILQIHNSYRSLVYPRAANMKELKWDNDLEDYSWNHTQACTGSHSDREMIKKWTETSWETWYIMAENLYYNVAPWYSIEEAIYLFWDEGKAYDIYTLNCTHKQTCGHYIALVLASSYRIGCAINTCNSFTKSTYKTPAIFFACEYNGMALADTRPYDPGPQGSGCRNWFSQFSFVRHGLCVGLGDIINNRGFDGNTSIVDLDYNIVVGIENSTLTTTQLPTSTTEGSTSTELSTSTTATESTMTTPESTITTTEETTTESTITTSEYTTTAESTTESTAPSTTESTTATSESTTSSTTESTTTTPESTTSLTTESTTTTPESTISSTVESTTITAESTTTTPESTTTMTTESTTTPESTTSSTAESTSTTESSTTESTVATITTETSTTTPASTTYSSTTEESTTTAIPTTNATTATTKTTATPVTTETTTIRRHISQAPKFSLHYILVVLVLFSVVTSSLGLL